MFQNFFKINLYAKGHQENPDGVKGGSVLNRVVVKTVKFDYYPNGLGNDIPNATSGKLALKNVYVTNYESSKGMSNPYHFKYFDTSDFDITDFPPLDFELGDITITADY